MTLDMELEAAVEHVMGGFAELQCHPDVVDGVRALSKLSLRLVTLSNGAASVAQRLLGDASIAERTAGAAGGHRSSRGKMRRRPHLWC
jgi:2-haloacid dehalogenase